MREKIERREKAKRSVGVVWRQKLMTIFAGIISGCKETDLWEVLSPFGVLMDVYIPRRQGLARGFTFTRFQHQEDFDRLLEKNLGIRNGS